MSRLPLAMMKFIFTLVKASDFYPLTEFDLRIWVTCSTSYENEVCDRCTEAINILVLYQQGHQECTFFIYRMVDMFLKNRATANILILGAIIIAGILFMILEHENNNKTSLKVWINSQPFSLDPADYDYASHHFTMRSIYWGLVSMYPKNGFKPIIASSWTSNNDHTEWRFGIKDNLTFSDGTPLRVGDVYKSLFRAIFLLKRTGSHSQLLENMKGIDFLSSLNANIDGLKIENNEIVIRYDRPNLKVLDMLAFGYFSIAHSSCWDESGNWKSDYKKSCPTSGAYKVKSWDSEELRLSLRSPLTMGTTSETPAKEIQFIWDPSKMKDVDTAVGSSNFTYSQDFSFAGPTPSGILFVRIYPYKVKGNALSDRATRLEFKRAFYLEMKRIYTNLSGNFFPNSLPKVNDLSVEDNKNIDDRILKKIKKIRFRKSTWPDPAVVRTREAILNLCKRYNIEYEEVELTGKDFMNLMDPDRDSYTADLGAMFTSIIVETPIEDVKFMLFSKEGIRLPDPTVKISQEIIKNEPDFNLINSVIWEDSIVWPIGHFSIGIWKKNSVRMDEYNSTMPPVDFSWINVDYD